MVNFFNKNVIYEVDFNAANVEILSNKFSLIFQCIEKGFFQTFQPEMTSSKLLFRVKYKHP